METEFLRKELFKNELKKNQKVLKELKLITKWYVMTIFSVISLNLLIMFIWTVSALFDISVIKEALEPIILLIIFLALAVELLFKIEERLIDDKILDRLSPEALSELNLFLKEKKLKYGLIRHLLEFEIEIRNKISELNELEKELNWAKQLNTKQLKEK